MGIILFFQHYQKYLEISKLLSKVKVVPNKVKKGHQNLVITNCKQLFRDFKNLSLFVNQEYHSLYFGMLVFAFINDDQK